MTLLVAAAGIAALPVSLHFEGNEGTAEPFLVVFPLVAFLAITGALIALWRRVRTLFVLNVLVAAIGLFGWIELLTYEGG